MSPVPRPAPAVSVGDAASRGRSPIGSTLRLGLVIVGAAALIAYPVLVYAALTQYSARDAGILLAAVFIPMAIVRARGLSHAQRRSFAAVPVLVGLCIAATVLANRSGFLLLAPVVTNLVLLGGFSWTLRRGRVPMIERFARLSETDLGEAELRWCRQWTVVWSSFFLFNVVMASALALRDDPQWWALYNGLVAYVIMGGLFAGEYVVRKLRFGRFGQHPLDRALARVASRRGGPS